jgi:hypothetical protein
MYIAVDHVSISQGDENVGYNLPVWKKRIVPLFLMICIIFVTLPIFGLFCSLFLPKKIMRGTRKEKSRW